jgi:hypothetical protein
MSKTPRLVGHSRDVPSGERRRHEKVEDFSSNNVSTRKSRCKKTKDEAVFALEFLPKPENRGEEEEGS